MTARRMACVAAGAALAVVCAAAPGSVPAPRELTLSIDPEHVIARFRPDRALGAGLDGHEHGDTTRIYSAANERAMGSAGLASISYRLRTELGVEAWHWNAVGRWSDARHRQGYWTSSSRPGRRPLLVSYGYRLPRRGDSIDQANDDGYSRLDDGRLSTFWKSDPYLDAHYTGEPNARHLQWVLVDLGRPRRIDAVQIDWGIPYATRFAVQRYAGPSAIALAGHPPGRWVDLPAGRARGRGGRQTVRVARRPRAVRFIRILLTQASRSAPAASRDVRDRLGFAIRELGVGRMRRGRFTDLMRHAPRNDRQTITLTSSTDPWHRARDRDPNTEQPGFDTILRSGLTHGLPLMVPVAVLYGTPADAVAEISWLRARRVPLRRIELGEEPDGQLAQPEDYGALYAEFARRLARVAGRTPLGGPGFQTSIPDWLAWPNRNGNRSWTRRFVAELRARRALGRLGFFSFEWYPFDNVCAPPAPQLARAPRLLSRVMARQRAEGLPASVPMVITEYGYSAFAGRSEVDLPGALLNADVAGTFLSLGGESAYLYGLEPDELIRESTACNTWGNLALWLSTSARRITHPLATLWAARLVSRAWTQPGDLVHEILATSRPEDPAASAPRVSAYAVRRPDDRIALMLVNRDPARAARVRPVLAGGAALGPLRVWTLSRATYRWQARGSRGHPARDRPPARSIVAPGEPVPVPPFSLVVAATARHL